MNIAGRNHVYTHEKLLFHAKKRAATSLNIFA